MPEELRPYALQIAVIAGAAIGLWFFWKLARAVVKWGFFVFYFVIGSMISLAVQPEPSVAITVGAGIAFAWTVMAIKSKLWKLIGAAAILAAMPFLGPIAKTIDSWSKGNETSTKPDSRAPSSKSPETRPTKSQQR